MNVMRNGKQITRLISKLVTRSRRTLSIKWKLFNSFLLFSLLLLTLLWFFQTVFLDPFYRWAKSTSIKNSVNSVVENIDHANLQTLIDKLSEDNEIQISIVADEGKSLIMQTSRNGSQFQQLLTLDYPRYYKLAEAGSGTYLEKYTGTAGPDSSEYQKNPEIFDPDQFQGRPPIHDKSPSDQLAYAILTGMDITADQAADFENTVSSDHSVSEEQSSITVMILARARLSPIGSTVSTLRLQLLIISAAMLLLSLVIALLQSKRFARPIEQINEQSRQLAAGNYSVAFSAEGYREIVQLADTLDQMAKDLNQVENLRRELIANVSHDLRTPLTMIGGYAEVMKDLPGEITEQNLQIIIDETKRLTSLVNDMLDISSSQAGMQVIDLEAVDLTKMLQEIIYSYSEMTKRDGYTIKSQITAGLLVQADSRRIQQVLTNLMINALNYTGDDLTILVKADKCGCHARVEILDSGEGIPDDQQDRIWDRYYRSDKAHRRGNSGSGLGLSIVRQILDQHQAAYGVSRRPEGGSNFWFELPLA